MNYPAFVASFTAAVQGSEPATAVAAVAAADAAAAVAAKVVLRKRKQRGEPVRQGCSFSSKEKGGR